MVRYRSTATSLHGMVASSHPLSTLAGVKILLKGGNAFDAALATNAALSVVQPHICGLGGDAFFLLFDSKSGKVEFLNASGRASRNASISFYEDRGFKQIPSRGILAALQTPGCVDGWFKIYEKHCSLQLQTLFADAIKYAEEGFPISHKLSEAITEGASTTFGKYKEWLKNYTKDGVAPRPGDVLKQPDLAWTLNQIASGGRKSFYEGPVAKRIALTMRNQGGLIDEDDLGSYEAEWGEPVSVKYRDYQIYETAPNSQAITALLGFNILSHYELSGMKLDSFEHLRLLIEASNTAYEYRKKYIADSDYVKISTNELLSEARGESDAKLLKEKLERSQLSEFLPHENAKDPGDTTYFCISDSENNCVSCIQSNYMGFGSGIVPEGTGINLQNRGSYFSLEKDHHNSLQPRKRTFHTLCASLTKKDDRPYLLFGSMGGDIQPQIHLQVISRILDFDTDVQQAIEDPRWCRPGTIYENLQTILVESRFVRRVINQLRAIGYPIQTDHELSSAFGHAQAIKIDDKSGAMFGGADPRGDGLALGV